MASASISEIKSYFLGNVTNDNGKSKEAVSSGDSFSAVFDKTQDSQPDTGRDTVRTSRKESDGSIQNHANVQKKNTPDKVKETGGTSKEIQEEKYVEEAMEEASAAMVTKVAETFNVSEEEVEQVLEALGLTALDLLSSENLTQVAVALNPGSDILSIVTNEELFADLKNLMNTAQDMLNQMSQDYQMSQEDMMSLLESMQEEAQNAVNMADAMQEIPVEEVQAETSEMDNVANVTVEVDDQTSQQTGELAGEKVEHADKKQESRSDSNDGSQTSARQSFVQNMLNQLAEAVDKSTSAQAAYGTSGQEIINQITEYIKVNIKPQTTEMELQLHPASLGTIKIQLASTEGMLTATFTTENEAVKAVLEAQIVQLKDNFEQQGLKVDAVEVNVAAKGFERNLDQQGHGQDNFQEQKSRGQRRIRLAGMENIEEDMLSLDMAEEDRIVADMMLRNGNTVDYTV